ncbi:MAG: class I SAM-dependent DNA methyltransferase [Verrucomicrobia bacterium]|nr:class I SAM-dependent DNA methyltransferase [Verrucomicrobiota bacterium]
MATGGDFLLEPIRHFNGSLFDATPVLELTAAEIAAIGTVAGEDWSAVDVSISGTLFERGLNPAKRSQLGSHYAHDLAQTVVWIGYIQWLRANGYGFPAEPILKRMSANFRCADALFTDWPEVDFIVSNPPFLGGKKLRTGDRKSAGSGLGDEYVEKLFAAYRDRVPAEADLCCYWFEKARGQIEKGKCQRAGLLATNSIRQQQNRLVLQRIKQSGDIFFAESDREWILDGANVRVSMVGFDDGEQSRRVLDGKTVSVINVNLTSQADITQAKRLAENKSIAFMGDTKGGAFDIEESLALDFLHQPTAHGIPNSQVVTPWLNGKDLTGRPRWMWIVDFGVGMDESRASRFEAPFEYVRAHVKPERDKNNREVYRRLWWQHVEARPGMRAALSPLIRFPATVIVAKHRLFVWIDPIYLPDHRLFVFAKDDDCFFGILHSRIHEAWSLSMGSTLEDRPSYSGSTCFETFPFPRPTPAQEAAIAAAAKELNELRERWLNPPEWTQTRTLEFPGSIAGPWSRYIEPSTLNPQLSTGLVRYPRLEPRDADCAAKLKKRTLTNLYNERPAWLDLAHKKLDAAVAAAYGFPADLTDEQILERLLALNLERAAEEEMAAKVKKPKASREKQADVMV